MRTSFPSARSAYAMASWDPMASPSGRTWDDRTKRCRFRISSAACWRAVELFGGVVIRGGIRHRCPLAFLFMKVAQDLLDPILVGDRLIEAEVDFGNAPQPQPATEMPPQERRRALEGFVGFATGLLVAEHGVENVGDLQVGRDLHASQRDEADARVVDRAPCQQLTDLFT